MLKREKFEPRWRKNKPPTPSYTFKGENVSLLPDDVGTWTPLSYFKMFWKHDLNVLLAEQTNIYSVEETGSSLNATVEEIEQLIGIQIYMSIIDFPNFVCIGLMKQGILLLQTSCHEIDIKN